MMSATVTTMYLDRDNSKDFDVTYITNIVTRSTILHYSFGHPGLWYRLEDREPPKLTRGGKAKMKG